MFRSLISRMSSSVQKATIFTTNQRCIATTASKHSGKVETRTDDEIDDEILNYLQRKDIDGWELRNCFQTIHFRDAIPEPKIIEAALRACRHQNDFALAVRFMEAVQIKCGPYKDKVWPWLEEQIKPTLTELGIPTLAEMGYNKPELYLKNVMDM